VAVLTSFALGESAKSFKEMTAKFQRSTENVPCSLLGVKLIDLVGIELLDGDAQIAVVGNRVAPMHATLRGHQPAVFSPTPGAPCVR
jgi:hypothetical protein